MMVTIVPEILRQMGSEDRPHTRGHRISALLNMSMSLVDDSMEINPFTVSLPADILPREPC